MKTIRIYLKYKQVKDFQRTGTAKKLTNMEVRIVVTEFKENSASSDSKKSPDIMENIKKGSVSTSI